MTAGARVLDLPRPALAVGEPADVCLVDLGRRWQVGEAGL